MRLLPLLLLFMLLQFPLWSQMMISTSLREDLRYSEETGEWKLMSSDEEELTFFEFNAEMSMFKHTTPSISSAYLIKEARQDEENEIFEFSVVSDVGNHYEMVLDPNADEVRFYKDYEEVKIMVRHKIKRIWFESEEAEEAPVIEENVSPKRNKAPTYIEEEGTKRS
ncbi:hypothetical protein SapgrDRAFT_3070 [Saprospira grandis DSM 2844]|uniref:Uncharacterized protein n=1 Tax=Saprospira grandis DSM 2844 TaxID=694433 RepID=J0P4D8_9BACT|nr:hypothetical protein [Saprospira grandis]EJF54719.1 hypothetical protein SapgrDRAFT_3070 [Saprospira grandis DSM 2844]